MLLAKYVMLHFGHFDSCLSFASQAHQVMAGDMFMQQRAKEI